MPRKRKMNDEHAAFIKKLGSLSKQRDAAMATLSDIDEQIMTIKNMLAEELAEGNYTAGRWVCNIKDKTVTGRKNTKWKSVAEDMNNGADTVCNDLGQKYPEAEAVLNKAARRMHKVYNDSYEAQTTQGEDSTTVIVTVERLSSKK